MKKLFIKFYNYFILEGAQIRLGFWIRTKDSKIYKFDKDEKSYHSEFAQQNFHKVFGINKKDIEDYIKSVNGNLNDSYWYMHYILEKGYGVRVNIVVDNGGSLFVEGDIESINIVKNAILSLYYKYHPKDIVIDIIDKQTGEVKQLSEIKVRKLLNLDGE